MVLEDSEDLEPEVLEDLKDPAATVDLEPEVLVDSEVHLVLDQVQLTELHHLDLLEDLKVVVALED